MVDAMRLALLLLLGFVLWASPAEAFNDLRRRSFEPTPPGSTPIKWEFNLTCASAVATRGVAQ
jgi:hypothetical protein